MDFGKIVIFSPRFFFDWVGESGITPITLNCIEQEGHFASPTWSAGTDSRCSQNGQGTSFNFLFLDRESLSTLVSLIRDSEVVGVLDDAARQTRRPDRTMTTPDKTPNNAAEMSNGRENPPSSTDDSTAVSYTHLTLPKKRIV